MNSDDSASRSEACEDLRPARLRHRPLRRSSPLIEAWRGDEALGQLGLGHLEREQRDGLLVVSAAFSAMLVTSADLPMPGARRG